MSSNFVPQILPNFVTQRSIYEARERPAKTYSWQVFLLSNILVELPWNTLMSVFVFVCWYYPIGFYRNAIPTDAVAERGGTMFLLMWVYMMYTSTFAHMIQAGVELAEMAGNFANLLFIFSLVFCGYVYHLHLLLPISCIKKITNFQNPRNPHCPPRLLALHVSRLAIHLSHLRHSLCRVSQYLRNMLVHRNPTLQSSPKYYMRILHGTIYQIRRWLSYQPFRNRKLRVLRHGGHEYISGRFEQQL